MRIAIIPARGGSRRIPEKNVRPFLGRPVLAWPIEVLRATALFDHIIVSTESARIADVAVQYGAETPFVRPTYLADDATSTDDVLRHALTQCYQLFGASTEACCVYPTATLLAADDLRTGLELLTTRQATSCFPVIRYDFPIHQALSFAESRIAPVFPSEVMKASNELPQYVHDAGQFYWVACDRFLADSRLFGENAVAFEIPSWRAQDINVEDDWRVAEAKVRALAL